MSFSCHQNVIKILCRLQANALIDLDLDVPVVDISRSPVETDPNFTCRFHPPSSHRAIDTSSRPSKTVFT